MRRFVVPMLLGVAIAAGGCGSDKKKDEAAADADKPRKRSEAHAPVGGNAKEAGRPKACVRAEACCEEMAYFRDQDPGFVCSGVMKAKTGTECESFHAGYKGVFEAAGADVPDECE